MQMRVTNFRDYSIVEKMICKYDISSPVEDTFHHFPFSIKFLLKAPMVLRASGNWETVFCRKTKVTYMQLCMLTKFINVLTIYLVKIS